MQATDQGCGLVLVADGDGSRRADLCRLLDTVGLPTVQAGSGEAALAVARATRPELAVLDVDLPLLSGYEVCRELKDELGDRIAVVFVSSDRVEPRDRVAGLYLGGDDYVTRPFDPGELVARVRRLLRAAPQQRVQPAAVVLTAREREVLALLAHGRSQAAIALELGITSKTVAN